MNTTPITSVAITLLAFGVFGCASAPKRPVYDASQVGQVISEEPGEIIAVRDVTIKAHDPRAATGGAGRQIGSAVGRGVMSGSVQGVAGAIGSVLGGNLGGKADDLNGEEITVRIGGSDRTIVVVQPRGAIPLGIGERVKVQTSGGASASGIYGGNSGTVKVVRENNFVAQAAGTRRAGGLSR